MRVIPVLDLLAGRAVHARRGKRGSYTPVIAQFADIPSGDALALARCYRENLGLRELYMADLDAITGAPPQHHLMAAIARAGSAVWLDAGIASTAQARSALDAGATRVIVGLETLPSFSALEEIVHALGADRVAFSLDLRAGAPLAPPDLATLPPVTIAEHAARTGVRTIIALDLARVGSGAGIDLPLIRRLRHALPTHELIVGGGLRSPADLPVLAQAGADAVLVGSAIYEGTIGEAEVEGFRPPTSSPPATS